MEPIKKIILVLEDEDLLLQAISKKLKLSGYGVVSCTQGKQALDYLASIEKKPDAIWLDYYLGDMNGLEFMKFVKDNPLWKDIPVMIVSNSAGEEKVHNMLALGAKKYILKANERLEDIIKELNELINATTHD